MDRLLPRDWTDFQHYKDRSPPWIRLHKSLLDNYDYQCLPVASRALAPMLWLIASDSKDLKTGAIEYSPEKIAFRLRMPVKDFIEALKPLIENRFFILEQDASSVLAEVQQHAEPEESRGETDTEEEEPLSGKPDDALEVLAYLNEKTDSAYRPVPSNLKLIRDRLKSGATVEQMRQVIDAKVAQWGADAKMQEYLRPKTLFCASNFEQYLGQLGKPVAVQTGPAWHETDEGYLAKAEELDIHRGPGEPFVWFKWRVAKRSEDQGVIDKLLSAAQRDGIAEHERAYKFFHGCLPGQMSRAA